MNHNLVKQLNDASKEVNLTIDKILGKEFKPRELYNASKHLINAGGKRFRPFLVLKSCEIVGGQTEVALPVAAAIEFIHNFTLIHDDIMDNDYKRRSVQTVHVLWGIPIAITAGDMLYAKTYETILHNINLKKVSSKRILRILDAVTEATISICEGQALDILFEQRPEISEEDYFKMIGKKTSALLQLATKSGAIIGGGSYSQVRKLDKFAYYAGFSFQVIDDILGLIAEENVLGKPVGNDIRKGKKTLIIIHTLAHANIDQRRQILSVLGNRKASVSEIQETIQTIRSLESIAYATKKAEEFVEKAKLQLYSFPPTPAKKALLNICDYILSRTF